MSNFNMIELKSIQHRTEDLFHVESYISGGNIYANSNTIAAPVVAPHSEANDKWMIRFSPSASFGRWANSRAIEKFFDTSEEVMNFLVCNPISIYQKLLEGLTQDYKELMEVSDFM